ncbi:MAG: DNA translocase FtsK [Rickettsiales bacterium]|jgi:S-DNA-T family DNA segregation ATPase FtsK/SpoIIIE|nr:DNA translocase FtsK [Rickettsiales bacterium]
MTKFKNRFLPLYKKIQIHIFGYFWFLFATLLLVSIISYSENDASFNLISTNININNKLGLFGSHVADLMIQIFGDDITILYSIIFFIFSYNNFTNHKVYMVRQKILAFFGFLLSVNILFESGFFGILLSSAIYYIPKNTLNLLSILALFISASVLLDIRKNKYMIYGKKFYNICKKLYFITTSENFRIKLYRYFKRVKKVSNDPVNEESKETKSGIFKIIKNKKKRLPRQTDTQNEKEEIVYKLPNTSLLMDIDIKNKTIISKSEVEEQTAKLLKTLKNYKIEGRIISVKCGPIITLYEFEPIAGTKSQRIISLTDDIAREMCMSSARIYILFGKNTLGIELPNKVRETIYIKELITSGEYKNSAATLPIILGSDIVGNVVVGDLAKMPHLLIAGTTGSGKSVGINTIITSILYKFTPDKCKFIMIDPKMLELSIYDNIPHLLTPVITEPQKAVIVLKWICKEMDERYGIMARMNVRNIDSYNKEVERVEKNDDDKTTAEKNEKMPYIVVIVDEMADLMLAAKKDIEISIQRLSQKARAAGIYIIMATQRPSVDVITGVIKSNFPTRISFRVVARQDSMTIMGEIGAEKLLGNGDMLYMMNGGKIIRAHCPFVSDGEVDKMTNFIRTQGFKPNYVENIFNDDYGECSEDEYSDGDNGDLFGVDMKNDIFQQALHIVKNERKCSASYFQTKLGIGYPRAAKIVHDMEMKGILSPPGRNGKRDILIDND